MSEQVLVIEDDRAILELIESSLARLGLKADSSSDGNRGLRKALENEYQLIILDLNLPGLDGMEICRRLRDDSNNVPVFILSARSEEIDRVMGLELGADDYLTKPFSSAEFAARIRSLLRRRGWDREEWNTKEALAQQPLHIDNLEIRAAERVILLDGQPIALTSTQFDLLFFLASHPGHAYTRAELIENVWGYGVHLDENNVNTQINKIRQVIDKDSKHSFIETVWGYGYRFRKEETCVSENAEKG